MGRSRVPVLVTQQTIHTPTFFRIILILFFAKPKYSCIFLHVIMSFYLLLYVHWACIQSLRKSLINKPLMVVAKDFSSFWTNELLTNVTFSRSPFSIENSKVLLEMIIAKNIGGAHYAWSSVIRIVKRGLILHGSESTVVWCTDESLIIKFVSVIWVRSLIIA